MGHAVHSHLLHILRTSAPIRSFISSAARLQRNCCIQPFVLPLFVPKQPVHVFRGGSKVTSKQWSPAASAQDSYTSPGGDHDRPHRNHGRCCRLLRASLRQIAHDRLQPFRGRSSATSRSVGVVCFFAAARGRKVKRREPEVEGMQRRTNWLCRFFSVFLFFFSAYFHITLQRVELL